MVRGEMTAAVGPASRAGAVVAVLLVVTVGLADAAQDPIVTTDSAVAEEPTWQAGVAMRVGTIPFVSEEASVTTFIPFVYYEGNGPFYFRGLETGLTFWKPGDWRFSAMGRLRFHDIPEEYQNRFQGDNFLWGLQARYLVSGPWHLDLEALSDAEGNEVLNARWGGNWKQSRSWLRTYLQFQYKTRKFNTHYYGLDREEIADGVEAGLGASALHTLVSNFFVFARGSVTLLDQPVREADIIDAGVTAQGMVGMGVGNDPTRTSPSVQKSKRYFRLAHGWVTPSSLQDILEFNAVPDPDNHQMTSLFYGHPLSDTLFGLPIQIFLHSGLGWHWANVKPSILEIVIAVKVYYTVPVPVRLRLGFGNGWSWVTDIPYVEETELTEKGYEPSPLLDYMDLSVDLNLGDAFGWIGGRRTLERLWLGYDIHHRSAIYETAQQFGRIKGGSNVQMVYLQYDF